MKTRRLIFDENRVLTKYFSSNLEQLINELDLRLMQRAQGELFHDWIKFILALFRNVSPTKLANFGIPSKRVTRYLSDVQQLICSRPLPQYKLENVAESDREHFCLAIAISDLIEDDAPRSIYTRASPTLVGVIIAKMGIKEFCEA